MIIIAFIGLLIGLAIGFYSGARFVSPRPPKIRAASFPSNVISFDKWRRLEQPTMKRRQRMDVIDVG